MRERARRRTTPHQQLCFEYQWSVICRLKMNLCRCRCLCSRMLQKPWINTLNTVVDHPVVFSRSIPRRLTEEQYLHRGQKKEKNLNKVFFFVWLTILTFFEDNTCLRSIIGISSDCLAVFFLKSYCWGKHLEFSSLTLIFFFVVFVKPDQIYLIESPGVIRTFTYDEIDPIISLTFIGSQPMWVYKSLHHSVILALTPFILQHWTEKNLFNQIDYNLIFRSFGSLMR